MNYSSRTLIAATLALFSFASCKDKKTTGTTASTTTTGTTSTATPPSGRFAYIDIDTFEANYTILKNKKADFNQRSTSIQNELQRSAQQLQNDAMEAQKKAQEGKMSESEGKATQQRLLQMQQSLETRKQNLEDQILKEQESFNQDLRKRLDAFLSRLSEERHYDFIFSYSKSNPSIMYANKGLDITQEVVKGMNDEAAKSGKTK